jgi:hypothetical protein
VKWEGVKGRKYAKNMNDEKQKISVKKGGKNGEMWLE